MEVHVQRTCIAELRERIRETKESLKTLPPADSVTDSGLEEPNDNHLERQAGDDDVLPGECHHGEALTTRTKAHVAKAGQHRLMPTLAKLTLAILI